MQALADAMEQAVTATTSRPKRPPIPKRNGTHGWQVAQKKSAPPSKDTCRCGGAGFVLLDDGGTGTVTRCPDCTDWLAHSRLTSEEQQHTLDHIIDRPEDTRGEMMALRFLGKEMLGDPFGFLSIWGKKGGGKSLLLTALVAEFCRSGRHARYFNAGEIVTLLSPGDDKEVDGFRHVAGNPDACKAKLKAVPVLAIDEVDKIRWTPWQVQQIGEVIEHRHRHAETHVTLFAMNRPPWEWHNAGEVEHVASRLSDGRFHRQWPADKAKWLPKCAGGMMELPGLFEVTLADIRPTLRRW